MMIPVTYGYARESKQDAGDRSLETQLRELELYGIRQEHVFSDVSSGRRLARPGWEALMARVREGDSIVVVWQDRLSRTFEDGVAIQADFIRRGIGIISIKENINTADDSAPARLYRHTLLNQGDYLLRSTAERIRVGQDRARAEGKRIGRPPAMTAEQVRQAAELLGSGHSLTSVARGMGFHRDTITRAVGRLGGYAGNVSPETNH